MSRSKQKLWSVLTYDLKTATDVCGFPCLLKTPSRGLPDESFLPLATKIKIETEIDLYTAHVRVIDYEDPDWIRNTKGSGFDKDRRQFLSCELLLPLSYPGQVRLCQSKKRKTYFNISEVAQDFPRLVRVEQEVACASPGESKVQVLPKGTLLQLDRLTKSTKVIRGMSETYLMFFEVGTGKAYGFPLLCAVHFTEVVDTFKYTLKEVINQLPVPRKVEFVGVNPYDIIVVEDEEALDLITILDGPIEIMGIRRLDMLVGLYLDDESNTYEMVGIPKDDSLLDEIRVHIPSTCLVDNDITFAEKQIPSRAKRDLFRNKLYALYVDDLMPVFLKNDDSTNTYQITDTSTPPPIPLRNYLENPTLPTAQSDSQLNDTDRDHFFRRRFKSLGDVTGTDNGEENAEGNGIRSFFSSMSRRLKRRTSTELANNIQASSETSLLNRLSTFKQSLGRRGSSDIDTKQPGAFVCYLNTVKEVNVNGHGSQYLADEIERESSSVTNVTSAADERIAVQFIDNKPFVHLHDNISINTAGCQADNDKNEIIYASVNWKSKNYGVVEVKERFCCDICKSNFLSHNTDTVIRNT